MGPTRGRFQDQAGSVCNGLLEAADGSEVDPIKRRSVIRDARLQMANNTEAKHVREIDN